jgi:hypothetical protein
MMILINCNMTIVAHTLQLPAELNLNWNLLDKLLLLFRF